MKIHVPVNLWHVALILLLFSAAVSPAQEKKETPSAQPSGLTVLVNGVREPVYKVADGVKPPQAIYQPEPTFSDEARKRKVDGTVTLGVIIASAGNTTHLRVLQGRGYGLDEKAIEAVRTWKFQPATVDGSPVTVMVAVEVSFVLTK
jgi:TonB family protein